MPPWAAEQAPSYCSDTHEKAMEMPLVPEGSKTISGRASMSQQQHEHYAQVWGVNAQRWKLDWKEEYALDRHMNPIGQTHIDGKCRGPTRQIAEGSIDGQELKRSNKTNMHRECVFSVHICADSGRTPLSIIPSEGADHNTSCARSTAVNLQTKCQFAVFGLPANISAPLQFATTKHHQNTMGSLLDWCDPRLVTTVKVRH